MRIVVISATDQPTLERGSNGLGRMAWEIATYLHKRGHEITLMAGPGSVWDDMGSLNITTSEAYRAENWEVHRIESDAYIDVSHWHELSRLHPEMPVINWIVDTECKYSPPNCVVGNEWQARGYPQARIVRAGIDVESIPFYPHNADSKNPTPALPASGEGADSINRPYVAFCAKIHHAKGPDLALEAALLAGVEIRFAGRNYSQMELLNHVGEINDNAALYAFVGNAIALIAPSRLDSGGRIPLEAAATGTPTITIDASGTQYHVKNAVSGFVCRDVAEMAEAIKDAHLLDRAKVRAWAKATHDINIMIDALEGLCRRVAEGERW